MSAESIWYYERGGERHGPVAAAEILVLSAQGAITPVNLVWRAGYAEWIPFSASELAPATTPVRPPLPVLTPAPPAIPPTSQPFIPREARLRPDFQPGIRSTLARSLDLLKSRFWPLVGVFALSSIILSVAAQFFIPIFFLMYPLMGGLYWYILCCVRGKEANLEMLFEGFRRQFGPLAITNLILMGVVTAVMTLFIIVGAVAMVMLTAEGAGFERKIDDPAVVSLLVGGSLVLSLVILIPLSIMGIVANFATLLILDCHLKAGEALSLGWRATKPHLIKLLLFMLVNVALSFVGMIALYVGMFVTGAWSSIALVYLYEDAFGDDPVA